MQVGRRCGVVCLAAAALGGMMPPARAEERAVAAVATITVEAGEVERIDTPMCVSLKGVAPDAAGDLGLVEVRDGKATPAASQLEGGSDPRICWFLSGTTPAGGKRVYRLVTGAPAAPAAVTVAQDDKALEIACGKRKVLRYHHAVMPAPEGVKSRDLYARSGFIHPLWSPAGAALTCIHPADHIHHMGIWNPWTNAVFEGRKVDFWNLGAGKGTVRFVEFASTASGPVFGGFCALQDHVDLSAPGGEKVALHERFAVRAWAAGEGSSGWIVDFTLTQRCASDSPLELPKYRYGGFGFRARLDWTKATSDYLTSEGKTRKDGHATRSRWCITHGKTEKGQAGIVFMSHPDNHEHPEPMRIWPDGKGLVFFNYCPVQQKGWTLQPGKDYVRRYRLYVYDGTIDAGAAERGWQDYGNGPKVAVAKGDG